jgi:CRP/FNR family cyclic AMP-dependent transcriptional regulator
MPCHPLPPTTPRARSYSSKGKSHEACSLFAAAGLTASSVQGKSLILRIAGPGELVGLPGTISGKPYKVTAESIEPTQANFIPRDVFLPFLRKNGEEAMHVAEMLNNIYHSTCRKVCYPGLSASAAGKLAMFLLDQVDDGTKDKIPDRKAFALSHEEIANMIGASRETVTRLFASFKRRS